MDFYATKHAGLIQVYLTNDPHEPWVARVLSEFSLYSTGKTPVEALTGLVEEAIPCYIEAEQLAGNKVNFILMELFKDLQKGG
jgi:predicted RNase H-like HicB family nuclease